MENKKTKPIKKVVAKKPIKKVKGKKLVIKNGSIILVSGKTKQAKIIQKFQSFQDKESSFYNHSGISHNFASGIYVIEASYIQQRKVKASIVSTPIEHYINDKENYDVLILEPIEKIDSKTIEKLHLYYMGTPYGYLHLTLGKIIHTIFNFFIRTKKKTDKYFICHEYSKQIFFLLFSYFEETYWQGNVKDIYHSDKFIHKKIEDCYV